jgi:hypothetical protein
VVVVAEEWGNRYGDVQVDIMKIDVEGAEAGLILHEGPFIRSHVRRAVIEWHKWMLSLEDLSARMAELGFSLNNVCFERETAGLATFDNTRLLTPQDRPN